MARKRTIDSAHIPLFNVFTGLAWALALKYAGTGSLVARDEILEVLKFFHALNQGADAFYFDAKLGRASLRRCMDVLALCTAIVMAGTGDLETFRFLRRMHGRTDADTPYGSHVAAHLAIGALFLAGGTVTFGTSDLAIASLMIAFYPLFPTDVHDNRVHLQAFRHLWVFAAEGRCLVVEDVDTQRPIHVDVLLYMKDGSQRKLRAPCLLPDLAGIKHVRTDDARYWSVVLDFEGNPKHVEAFKQDPRVFVRRCPAKEAHSGVVSASLAALNAPITPGVFWHELFKLKAMEGLDRGDVEELLPAEVFSRVYVDRSVTGIGERLALQRNAKEGRGRDELWNLRLLFAWAERERQRQGDGKLRWIGESVVEGLRGIIAERGRR
jgi:anaphase-promoting complex subunit 1